MMEELAAALQTIENRNEISVLVISGEGKSFSAGVDVAANTPEKVGEMLAKFHAVIRALLHARAVTVAKVHGNCLGGGAELALVCDVAYTTSDAQWGFPEITLGCFPPVASAALAAVIGQKRATEMILSGAAISGSEAAQIRLANASGMSDEMQEKISALITKLAALSPLSLAITKRAIYGWDAAHVEKGLARAEQIYLDELMKTADAREGIAAWMEKRKPKWDGR